MQINIGHLDEDGVYNKQFTTFALNGKTRGSVRPVLLLGLLSLPSYLQADWVSGCRAPQTLLWTCSGGNRRSRSGSNSGSSPL